jgi:heat shock protein HslJ
MIGRIALVAFGLALAGCAGEPGDSPLEGTPWRLVQLDGQAIVPGTGDRAAHLVLQPATGRATGSGGCNRFTGGYQLQGDNLQIGPLAATKMACLENGTHEPAFFAALDRVRRWVVNGRQLLLTDANGALLLRLEAAGS